MRRSDAPARSCGMWALITCLVGTTGAAGNAATTTSAAATATATSATAPAAATALAPPIIQLDALFARRDDPRAAAEAQRLADAAVAAAPGDYATLWRAARAYFTLSDEPNRSDDDRSRLGKAAWDLAIRATAIKPGDAAGHYWAALSIGSYALGMGIVRAIANGIEGKFKGELERATALDPSYDHGNVPVVWAAYYLEVPWPKRDRQKAGLYIASALKINPANLRARLYQARILADQGHVAEARALINEIAATPVGRYDAPEEKRVKIEAAQLAGRLPKSP